MSGVTRPRGPLPARVYWTRRVMLVGLALGLVYGLAHLLGGRSLSPEARPVGAAVGSTTTPSAAAGHTAAPRANVARPKTDKTRGAKPAAATTPTPTPLAVPSGPCAPTDVQVAPSVVGTAYAGSPVRLRLTLTTGESPACTWRVSPDSLVLKLTSGNDRIWSSQDCQAAIPAQQVVVRKDHPTSVVVTWRGQRSDGTCSRTTPWAEPGYYTVAAAALGAEPADYQFELHRPQPVTITPSPSPDQGHGHGKGKPDQPPGKRKQTG